MTHPFFEFFNKNRPYIDPDSSKWPKEWSTVYFKSYPRLPQIKLPKPKLGNFSLEKAILNRESNRNFSGKPIKLEELAALLYYGAGITKGEGDMSRRAHPSGGARYPLEVYPFVFNIDGLNPGVYHYNVKNHHLELLLADKENLENSKNAFYGDFISKSSVIFVITMVPWRSSIKYGNFALKLGLLEAGHISQNIYLLTQVLKLKCCALGGFEEKLIHRLLDIDGITETAFYALAVSG